MLEVARSVHIQRPKHCAASPLHARAHGRARHAGPHQRRRVSRAADPGRAAGSVHGPAKYTSSSSSAATAATRESPPMPLRLQTLGSSTPSPSGPSPRDRDAPRPRRPARAARRSARRAAIIRWMATRCGVGDQPASSTARSRRGSAGRPRQMSRAITVGQCSIGRLVGNNARVSPRRDAAGAMMPARPSWWAAPPTA